HRKKNGEIINIAVITQYIKINQQEGFYTIFEDISEQKATQKYLENAKKTADEANEAKSTFLANMSHEIRTPMNAILGFLEILTQTSMSPEQARYLSKIDNASKALLSLLNDILDLSKIEAGKYKIMPCLFKPKELFTQSLELFEIEAAKKNLLLEYELDTELPEYLYGDKERIVQILVNLISNAIKFTNHGSIHVAIFKNHGNKESCNIEFVVTDTGLGISQENQEYLFELFTQIDSSTTRKEGGTGLGLAISKQLVEAMGGTIEVESEIGEGSSFSFTLNLGVNCNPIVEENVENFALAINDLNILLVEDNDDNREVAKLILNNMGVNVDEAINGQLAIDMIKIKNYDIVLMDIQMPVLDGLDSTRIIRQNGFVELPIIALSANTSEEEQKRSTDAGMNYHLNKPFKIKELENIILKYAPNKAVKTRVDSTSYKVRWNDALIQIPGLVVDDDIRDYWLSKDAFLKQLQPFIHNTISTSDHLHQLINEKKTSEALTLLHKFKGNVKLFGAKRLFREITQLETALKENDNSKIKRIMKKFDDTVKELTQ
ncbi:response regulator, partial [bacterium]|nr:response regulator [bacterium]